jgi:hypothetical protein
MAEILVLANQTLARVMRKTLQTLAIFQKNGPTDNSWAKGEWWCNADLGSNSLLQQVRKVSGVCPLFAEIVCFTL